MGAQNPPQTPPPQVPLAVWGHLWPTLGSLWLPLGTLGLPLAVLWDPLGYLGPPFGSLWGALGLPLAVLWGPCGHCGAQGAGPWASEEKPKKTVGFCWLFYTADSPRFLRGFSADPRRMVAALTSRARLKTY